MCSKLLVVLMGLLGALQGAVVQRAVVGASENDVVVSSSHRQFALAVFKQLALKSSDANMCMSPWSLYSVLGAVQSGARGKTLQQLRRVMRLPTHTVEQAMLLEMAFKNVTERLKMTEQSDHTLNIANKIYSQRDLGVKEVFRQTSEEYFNAETEPINFQESSRAVKKINDWVKQKTEGKIAKLLETLSPYTQMVLLNTIYFKGTWQSQFEKRSPSGQFQTASKGLMNVNMMKLDERDGMRFKTHYDAELKAQSIILPYEGGESAMVIILPDRDSSLQQLQQQMTVEKLSDFISDVNRGEVFTKVEMPKFKIEAEMDVKELLLKMGVTDLFDASAADLGGIADGPLYVSKAVQKTYIAASEEGTEAAAATAFVGMFMSSPPSPFQPPKNEFKADRPFIYVIKHTKRAKNTRRHYAAAAAEETILFMGQVTEPSPYTKPEEYKSVYKFVYNEEY